MTLPPLPPCWAAALAPALAAPTFTCLLAFLEREYAAHTILPPPENILHALQATPLSSVKALILGQDPYPTPGHAHGLCFSVSPGIEIPRSLANIYKEIATDTGRPPPPTGNLSHWARQGVLLLNTTLTTRAHQPMSHQNQGWEPFTDAIISAVNAHTPHTVFILWGSHALSKKPLIDPRRHTILTAPHPSPLSAHRGFFGSRPFTQTNASLILHGQTPIEW